jgi:hypothetical protein
MSHSRRSRQKIEFALPETAEDIAALADHPNLRALYPEMLVTVHQAMRSAVVLLRTAATRCRELADADPVAAALAPYCEYHPKKEDHAHWSL